MKSTIVGQTANDVAEILLTAAGVRRTPDHSDADNRDTGSSIAVVMGAQVLSGGRASRTLRARTLHAAEIYRTGGVEKIIVTGGIGEYGPPEADVMAGILTEAGVPDEVINRERKALSTHDSAQYVSRMMKDTGVGKVRVVTDPLHCIRTVAAFEDAGLRAISEPVYSSPMWRVKSLRVGQMLREIGASVWYRTHHGVGSRSRRL